MESKGGRMNKYAWMLDQCCGKVPKPCVRPKLTGIERNQLERLDHIEAEYQQKFGGKQEV